MMRRLLRLAAALCAVTALATCSPGVVPDRGGIAVDTGPWSKRPVAVPEQGALLGAWVRPASFGQPGRAAAIAGFEQRLGRKLDIVHSYRRMHEPIGTTSDLLFISSGATLMLSWAGTDTREITAGLHDSLIAERARQARALRAPVLLRFRWEMDRPNLRASMHSGADYIAAWHHVRRIFAAQKADNISWVWCPTAEGFIAGHAPDYYPGDDAVDWTCVDVYAGSKLRPIDELLEPFLRWAGPRPKPIMIGEYGVSRAWPSDRRAAWLRDAAKVFQANPQIKAVLYFESNPDGRTPGGEFRLSDDPPALDAFIETARLPWFTRSDP